MALKALSFCTILKPAVLGGEIMVQGSKSQTALPEDLPSALQGGSQSSATAVTGNPPPFCPLRTPEMHRYTHTGKAPDAEHKIKII